MSRTSPFTQSDLNRIAKAAKLTGMCAEIDFAGGKVRLTTDSVPQSVRVGDTDPSVLDEIRRVLGDG